MKKLIILILLCIPLNIYAEDIKYSNEYTEDENYNIIEEKLYKFYEEEKIYSDNYYLKGENIEEYPHKSSEYITKQSEFTLEKPEEIPNRTIKEKNAIGYYSLKPINRILIKNVFSNSMILSEIEVYYKGEKLDYDYTCYDCKGHSVINMNDGIFNSSNGSINFASTIEINLQEELDPYLIEVNVFFYTLKNEQFYFEMYYFDKEIDKKFTYPNSVSGYDYIKFTKDVDSSTFNKLTNVGKVNIKLEKENIVKTKWDDKLIITDEILDDNFYQKVGNVKLYSYTDTYFKYYKINKRYLKGYYLEMDDYIKDEKDYIIRYKYTKKEYVETSKEEQECKMEKIVIEKDKEKTEEKQQSNIVINKTIENKKIDKFRHAYIVIILLVLFLMGYMLYSLGRE